MSTKIFNGFRFAPMEFGELDLELTQWKERVKTLTIETASGYMAKTVISKLDGAISKGEAVPERLFGNVWADMHDRQREIKKTQRRDPPVDFEFEIVIIPDGNTFYGLYYTEQGKWADEFRDQPYIQDYSYWNNTDKPDEVTDAEWEERELTWNRLLPRVTTPAQRGYTVTCTYDPSWSELLDNMSKYVPSNESRARTQAHTDAMNDHMKRHMPENPDERMSVIMKLYRDANEWTKTDDGIAFMEQRFAHLLPLIVPVTKETIL